MTPPTQYQLAKWADEIGAGDQNTFAISETSSSTYLISKSSGKPSGQQEAHARLLLSGLQVVVVPKDDRYLRKAVELMGHSRLPEDVIKIFMKEAENFAFKGDYETRMKRYYDKVRSGALSTEAELKRHFPREIQRRKSGSLVTSMRPHRQRLGLPELCFHHAEQRAIGYATHFGLKIIRQAINRRYYCRQCQILQRSLGIIAIPHVSQLKEG